MVFIYKKNSCQIDYVSILSLLILDKQSFKNYHCRIGLNGETQNMEHYFHLHVSSRVFSNIEQKIKLGISKLIPLVIAFGWPMTIRVTNPFRLDPTF